MVELSLKGLHGEKIIYNHDAYTASLIKEINTEYLEVDFSKICSKDNIILDCFSSATIEGANTSIENIRKNKTDKSTVMASNCISVVNDILSNQIDVTKEKGLLAAWKIVVDSVCENEGARGEKYRSGMVVVGNHTPEKPDSIDNDMKSLFEYINQAEDDPLVKACVAHWYFVYVHPFCDGNGRMSRLLLSSVLRKYGFVDIFSVPISNLIMNNVDKYHKSIALGEKCINDTLDITEHINYMLKVIKNALCFIKTKGNPDERLIFDWMSKHKGAAITVKKCAEHLEISDNKARRLLEGMVNRGTLIKYKDGNKNYYRRNYL